MRNRIFAVFAIAVLAGGGLAYGTYNLVQNQPAQAAAAVATQPVVVAAADLQLGSELKKEDLTVVNFPAGQAPEGTFTQPSDVVGRGLIVPIVKNEPVLPSKLASKEAGAGLPPVIPEGMRAVSVRVNEVIGVAGYVLPGTRVDVVATASPNQERADMTSKLILSNVQVLTAGTRMEQDQEKGKPDAGHGRDAAGEPGAVRAAGSGEHRRQDSAGAPQSPGSDRAGNARREDGRAGRHGPRPRTGLEEHGSGPTQRARDRAGRTGDADRPDARGAAHRRSDPRRQAGAGSNQVLAGRISRLALDWQLATKESNKDQQ